MQNENTRRLLAALEACARSGNLGDLQIEYWFGGGPPPPYYRSEQLRLFHESGKDVIQYAELKFDDRFNPSSITQRYRIAADKSQVREFVQLLLEKKLFESSYPEERKLQDSHAFEFSVTMGDISLTRKYFRRLPEELHELEKKAATLIHVAMAKGDMQFLHQGKQIPDYSPPGQSSEE